MMGFRIVKFKFMIFQSQEGIVTQGLVVEGVCVYVRNTVNFIMCHCFSNSVCELLIFKLLHPSIIMIIIYRPPSCIDYDSVDVISRHQQYILLLFINALWCWPRITSLPLPRYVVRCD